MLQNEGVLYILTYKCASRHSGVPFLDIGSSKSAPYPSVFSHVLLQMCFAPQRRTILPDQIFQNAHENLNFSTFWLANVLRATAAYDFSTSAVQKAVRDCGVLCILTAKCASRHSRVPFFRMRSGNIGPGMRFFVQFDLQMCFAPQRSTIFHLSAEQLPPHPPL